MNILKKDVEDKAWPLAWRTHFTSSDAGSQPPRAASVQPGRSSLALSRHRARGRHPAGGAGPLPASARAGFDVAAFDAELRALLSARRPGDAAARLCDLQVVRRLAAAAEALPDSAVLDLYDRVSGELLAYVQRDPLQGAGEGAPAPADRLAPLLEHRAFAAEFLEAFRSATRGRHRRRAGSGPPARAHAPRPRPRRRPLPAPCEVSLPVLVSRVRVCGVGIARANMSESSEGGSTARVSADVLVAEQVIVFHCPEASGSAPASPAVKTRPCLDPPPSLEQVRSS